MNMRKIYRKIAKEHGTTVAEVKKEMQNAINYAYQHTPDDGVTAAYQNRVPRKGEIPTSEELIRYCAGEVKRKSQFD